MITYLAEHEKYIIITGLRDVRIDDAKVLVEKAKDDICQDTIVQFFNGDLVATWEHLYFAALNALNAFASQKNISRNITMEMMLYASTQRQISRAIEFIGIKNGVSNLAIVAIDNNRHRLEASLEAMKRYFGKEPDDRVLELSANKMKYVSRAFRVMDKEIETMVGKSSLERTLVELIIERMALLSIQS